LRLSLGRNTSAISSSFHTQIALTITSVNVAAAEIGSTIRRSASSGDAPSTVAASISSRGNCRKKFTKKNTENGSISPE